jgi:hypothetical protein
VIGPLIGLAQFAQRAGLANRHRPPEGAGIIVKKAFISEAGVIRVRLIERVLVSAHFAFDREHGSA